MRDISSKQITLRSALATGIVFCQPETLISIRNNTLPKGNLFDVARAAGFLGAKATPQLLPHCHPVAIDAMDIQFEFLDAEKHTTTFGNTVIGKSGIVVTGTAKSIGRTGIEMEMLTAVSVACLEIYDMLKPVDKALEISCIKLLDKKGGKSDRKKYYDFTPQCAVLVCSDSTAAGTRKDNSGKIITQMLENAQAEVVHYKIVPDEALQIQETILKWVEEGIEFIFTTGGTGLSPRDNTVQAVRQLIENEAQGIMEAIRNYGQMRTPLAMMSRGVAGTIKQTLIVTLPGSSNGARESMEAILPAIFHARKMILGGGH